MREAVGHDEELEHFALECKTETWSDVRSWVDSQRADKAKPLLMQMGRDAASRICSSINKLCADDATEAQPVQVREIEF